MWLSIAAVSGALAIAAGAFGAHGLRDRVTPDQVAAWSTAAQYQLIHSAVLLARAGTLGSAIGWYPLVAATPASPAPDTARRFREI